MSYVHIGRRVAQNDETYAYNARSELTNATSSVNAAYRYAYDFDDIGNRETSLECGAAAVDYTVNNLNQYTSIASQSSQSTFTPTYDADGNQTTVKTKTGIWQVAYNAENRPVRWTCGTTNLVMAFDRMGRRVRRIMKKNRTAVVALKNMERQNELFV